MQNFVVLIHENYLNNKVGPTFEFIRYLNWCVFDNAGNGVLLCISGSLN